jgi:hypothetical protein
MEWLTCSRYATPRQTPIAWDSCDGFVTSVICVHKTYTDVTQATTEVTERRETVQSGPEMNVHSKVTLLLKTSRTDRHETCNGGIA